MRLLTGPLPADADPALEMALPLAMLHRAGRGADGDSLRIWQPARDTVAFGRRDTRLPGFPAAVEAAREAGFAPVIRSPGGHVVAWTGAAVVVDHVGREHGGPSGLPGGMTTRFDDFGTLYADALRQLGIDARLGEVPGEYCPGSQSINARGVAKLVGTAQRMVRGAWLFGAAVVVADGERLRSVLARIHDLLGLPFDPATVGTVSDEVPGLHAGDVEEAVLDGFAGRYELVPGILGEEELTHARTLVTDLRA